MNVDIGCVRVQAIQSHGRAETTLLRLRLAQRLGSAELAPPALPPSAVLVVRCLTAPVPVQLTLRSSMRALNPAWERATRQTLADTYRRAVRPGQEDVPASAEAVVFADEGEMLACLALDMSRGEAAACWWWRALLRTLPSPSTTGLTTLWCRRATAVPAALHYLAARGQAVTVMQALTPPQALAVLAALGQTYGMADVCLSSVPSTELARAAANGDRSQTQEPGSVENLGLASAARAQTPLAVTASARARETPPQSTPTGPLARPEPPWAATLVPAYLEKAQACLLGVGLTLYAWPAVAHSSTFLSRLRAWWREQGATAPVTGHAASLSQEQGSGVRDNDVRDQTTLPPALEQAALSVAQTSSPELEDEVMASRMLHPGHTRSSESADQRTVAGSQSGDIVEPVRESVPHVLQHVVGAQGETSQQPDLEDQTSAPSQTASFGSEPLSATRRDRAFSLEQGVPTVLGGVLYLINLMCQLDLPACFEADWELESQVGAWGVLELLGRGLLARESQALPSDPLWTALAQLSGREPDEFPGAALRGNNCFALPVAWATQLASGREEYYWAVQDQQLRLWSAAGYMLLECPQDTSSPTAQAQAALQEYVAPTTPAGLTSAVWHQAPLANLTGPLVAGVHPALRHWLALVLPYLRRRLQQALRLTTAEAGELARTLLLYPGQLYITSTHVDLVLRLQDISLPARLAGLDRSPGWLADFGRVVLLHFE